MRPITLDHLFLVLDYLCYLETAHQWELEHGLFWVLRSQELLFYLAIADHLNVSPLELATHRIGVISFLVLIHITRNILRGILW